VAEDETGKNKDDELIRGLSLPVYIGSSLMLAYWIDACIEQSATVEKLID